MTSEKSRKSGSKKAGKDRAADAAAPTVPADETDRKADTKEARRRASGETRARLNESLILELRALRADLTQATEAFDLRIGGRIAEMEQLLVGDESLDQKPRKLTVARTRAALAELAGEPPTGTPARIRELRRIQRLVRRLRRIITAG